MTVSFNPIGSWPLLVGAAVIVLFLTLWAYARKFRGSSGRWRWVAIGLRLMALLLCLIAALRPSVVLQEKKKQAATIVFLIDSSTSMTLQDEVNGQKRWDVGKKALEEAVETAKSLGPNLETAVYRFDSKLAEFNPDDKEGTKPEGHETNLGGALLESEKRVTQNKKQVARIVVFSDFSSNSGRNPLEAARQLRDHQVPTVTVGLGSDNAGKSSRDIAIRDLVVPPSGFVKNKLEVKGTLMARGFTGKPIEVKMFVEGQAEPVARTTVTVPEGAETAPINSLFFVPQTPGEKMVTLEVAQQEGEFVTTNNKQSSFLTVLSGGLNVMFLQGPNFTWDYRFLMRSIMTAQDIQVDGVVIRRKAQGEVSEVDDAEFAPGRYNIYILSDMAADFLAPHQHKLLAQAVSKGAGLMMLGGRSSFGAGGWAQTALADILPVEIHPNDGQIEPEGGIKFVPSGQGLTHYLLQIGANKTETAKLWDQLPPILGTNRFGEPKQGAEILAQTGGPNPEPLMLAMEVKGGRVIAYGGDTWVWARASEEGRVAHRKFWRQVIFWLSHKENEGDNQVRLTLDRRRVSIGQNVELSVQSRDAKGAALTGVSYETKVEREGLNPTPESVDLYTQGEESRGVYAATGQPGTYKATVVARKDGKEIGQDSCRFLVYQDDRELENPSADLMLARHIAEITGGESVAHESLNKYLKGIDQSTYTEYLSPAEHRIWDNWPFLLAFAALLTLEWWLRKRHGWV